MSLQTSALALALLYAVGFPSGAVADQTPTADSDRANLTAVDLFMRDQAVVLKPKQVVLELNALRSITYGEPQPSPASAGIPTEHSLLSFGLGAQVGIADGLSAYANLPFERTIEAAGYTGAGKRTARTEPGSVTVGFQKTLLTESADLPMLSLNAHGQLATNHDGRNGLGAALNVSRSVDPAIVFGSLAYNHLFEGQSGGTPARAMSTVGLTGGVALAVNDKVSVSGSLAANYTPDGFIGRERYRTQLGLTYTVSRAVWVEASAGWGLNGPGSDAAVGITAGFQFQ